jgi:predicted DNA binding CopG/RHH family protein
MTKPHKKDPLPENVSREALAHFWDTHSIADYQDDLQPVAVRLDKGVPEGITIRFNSKTLETLRHTASRMGIGPTTLIRMWVLERLERTQAGA